MASILVADDDADTRDALCTFLERTGHRIQCVPNGREALKSILAEPPDLIILDLLMPECCGAGVLEVLRAYLRLQNLPVVIWTGVESGPILDRARALKANAILVKGKTTLREIQHVVDRELREASN
jgi:CheY-like chemotaxis protein